MAFKGPWTHFINLDVFLCCLSLSVCEGSKAWRLREARICSQCICQLHNATCHYESIKSSPCPWGLLRAQALGLCSVLFVRASLYIKLVFGFTYIELALCVCDSACTTGSGVCVHACLGEDLAAVSARECCWHKGKATAFSPHTTISMASIVPSKQWWVSAWG